MLLMHLQLLYHILFVVLLGSSTVLGEPQRVFAYLEHHIGMKQGCGFVNQMYDAIKA